MAPTTPLDGPTEDCMRSVLDALRPPGKPSSAASRGDLYIVAVGVAPTAAELARCTTGIEVSTDTYIRQRRSRR